MRVMVLVIISAAALGCAVRSQNQVSKTELGSPAQDSSRIDGVYRLVSETLLITSPRNTHTARTAEEYEGLWFFQNGFFSKNIMRRSRTEWTPEQFPSNAEGTGFDGAAGTYQVRGKEIHLNYDLAFYPGAASDSKIFQFDIDGNSLMLTQVLMPSRETESEGVRVLVLEKIR